MTNAKEYYDNFATKLLRDFVSGNPRTEAAISFACGQFARSKCKAILDLGCGIGWSSFELSRAIPEAGVVGLDLSSQLIEISQRLFARGSALRYVCGDLTGHSWRDGYSDLFDGCVMLDVYEHIPKVSRAAFHDALSSVLTSDAAVVMTAPTPLHQAFLRASNPKGLQPVDEDVTLADLQRLAAQLNAEITHFEYKSVWATDDYFHAVLNRKVSREDSVRTAQSHQLLSKSARVRHVRMAADVLGAEAMDELTARQSLFKRAVRRLRHYRISR